MTRPSTSPHCRTSCPSSVPTARCRPAVPRLSWPSTRSTCPASRARPPTSARHTPTSSPTRPSLRTPPLLERTGPLGPVLLFLLELDLDAVVRWHDLDVAGPHAHAARDARRDDRALEDQLVEPPLFSMLAQLDHDAARTSPHPFTRRLEAPGDELAHAIGDRFRRRLGFRPGDRLHHGQVWWRAWCGRLPRPRLLQREAEQLRTFLLREEGA